MYQSTKGLVWNINALVLLPLLQFLLLLWPILWGFRTSSGQAHTLFLINSCFPYFFIRITDVDRARVIAVTCHSSQCRSTTLGVTCYNNVNWRGREKTKTWHISKRLSFFFFHYDCAIIIFALVFSFVVNCGPTNVTEWRKVTNVFQSCLRLCQTQKSWKQMEVICWFAKYWTYLNSITFSNF